MELEGFKFNLTKTQVIDLAMNKEHPYMVLTPHQYLDFTLKTFKSKNHK